MSDTRTFRGWLQQLRLRRDVCQLLPMEAAMGCPIEVQNAREYLIPFYRVSADRTTCSPPFACLRVSYPEGDILSFNRLFFDSMQSESIRVAPVDVSAPEDYYAMIDRRIQAAVPTEDPDDKLRAFLDKHRPQLRQPYEALLHARDQIRSKEAFYLHENH